MPSPDLTFIPSRLIAVRYLTYLLKGIGHGPVGFGVVFGGDLEGDVISARFRRLDAGADPVLSLFDL